MMKKVKITVIRKANHADLSALYESEGSKEIEWDYEYKCHIDIQPAWYKCRYICLVWYI